MRKSTAERSADYRAKDVDGYRAKKREYAKTPEQRAKRTEYMRGYREENREKMNAQANESHKRARIRNPAKQREMHLKYTYGITQADFDAMLKGQNGMCLICKSNSPRGKKAWHVDHCHASGKVRGLLCNMCNPRLGWYERHSAEIVKYLEGQVHV